MLQTYYTISCHPYTQYYLCCILNMYAYLHFHELNQTYTVTKEGRVHTKKSKYHWCVLCNQPTQQLARHCERLHKDEKEIISAMSFKKKKSGERCQIYDVLRKHGDFAHNMEVEKSGMGKLVVVQRSCTNLHASIALAILNKISFAAIIKRASSSSFSSSRVLTKSNIFSIAPGANEHLKEVFNRMRVDQVSTTCKSDELIILYGNALVMEHTEDDRDQFDVISN